MEVEDGSPVHTWFSFLGFIFSPLVIRSGAADSVDEGHGRKQGREGGLMTHKSSMVSLPRFCTSVIQLTLTSPYILTDTRI